LKLQEECSGKNNIGEGGCGKVYHFNE